MWKLTQLSSLQETKSLASHPLRKNPQSLVSKKMKMKEKEKTEQGSVYSIYLSIYIFLQWMQGNIYRDVFPTFLTKKSYGWWITRRRMEIYAKISEEKYPKVSVANIGKLQEKFCCTVQNGYEIIS